MDTVVVPLHEYPEYLLDCCDLINNEWKRSQAARLHSLKSSSCQLPTSLILLEKKELVGHLKLSPIPSIRSACFVESVVITKNLRGKGYGSLLMKEAEQYCQRKLQMGTIYLSTKDQLNFYSKLGYTECKPISIYGTYDRAKHMEINSKSEKTLSQIKNNAPPPPPPLPNIKNSFALKTYMCKKLIQ